MHVADIIRPDPQSGRSNMIRVRNNRLIVQSGARYFHFDSTGRLVLATAPHEAVRRGLDNRLLRVITPHIGNADKDAVQSGASITRYAPRAAAADASAPVTGYAPGDASASVTAAEMSSVAALVYRTYQTIDGRARDEFYREAYGVANEALAALDRAERSRWHERLSRWSPAALADDEAAFRGVYAPVSILPPEQYHALVVQVTLGCSYNKCLFCDFYRDRRFHIRSESELESHLDKLTEFLGPERMADRKSVFLADGNAFVVPTKRLLQMITQIKRRLPAYERAPRSAEIAGVVPGAPDFHAFMDTFTLEHKQPAELREIYQAGLHTVYTGLETGSNRLREFLRKPGTADEVVTALNQLKEAGFALGAILLVGVGGPAAADEHLRESLATLSRIQFTPGDVIYLSPFVDPDDTGYPEALSAAGLDMFTADGLAAQVVRWRRELAAIQASSVNPLRAKVTLYSILEHIYA